jgi:Ca-activated chloride channel family protein
MLRLSKRSTGLRLSGTGLQPVLGCLTVGVALFLAPVRQAAAQDETPLFHTETNLVTLRVTILDKNGKLVTNIPQAAFKVYEDNVEQPLKVFQREDVPVSMCIVLDNSGSMKEKRSSVAAAALALVKASNPDDEVCIVNFNDEPYLDQAFTNDVKKMEDALEKLDAHGGTAMRNAISATMDTMRTDAKRDKKVLVVVTDGNDNGSDETSLEQLVRKAQSYDDILIYSIGLLSEEEPGEARKARHALKTLAEASGGFAYYPKNLSEVQTITPQIAREIRNQYTLAYNPTNLTLDGKFRTIRVTVKGYGNVRAKNGYYAKAAPSSAAVPASSFNKP